MFFSNITSKDVSVVLVTSTYFSGIGNDSSLGTYSLTLGSTWWRWIQSPELDQKLFLASPSYHEESWKGVKNIRLILPEDVLVLLLGLGDPGLGWMFSDPDLLQGFWLFHLRPGIQIVHHVGASSTLPLHWVFSCSFPMRPSVPIPQCLRPRYLLSKFFPRATHIQIIYMAQDFWTDLMQSRQVFGRNRAIFYHRSKRNNRAIKWYSEPPSIGCLPSDKRFWIVRR